MAGIATVTMLPSRMIISIPADSTTRASGGGSGRRQAGAVTMGSVIGKTVTDSSAADYPLTERFARSRCAARAPPGRPTRRPGAPASALDVSWTRACEAASGSRPAARPAPLVHPLDDAFGLGPPLARRGHRDDPRPPVGAGRAALGQAGLLQRVHRDHHRGLVHARDSSASWIWVWPPASAALSTACDRGDHAD